MFFICFYRFSTEELRLATGASAPVARKNKKFFICFYRGNSEGNVYSFQCFFKKHLSPPPVKIKKIDEKVGFCFLPPPLQQGVNKWPCPLIGNCYKNIGNHRKI